MDNLLDKIVIAIEKFIFGDSIIERVNQTLKEVNDKKDP